MAKKIAVLLPQFLLILLATGLMSCSSKPQSENEKMSYALGVQVGETLKRQKIDIDDKNFLRGLKDSTTGQALRMEQPEIQTALASVHKAAMDQQMIAAQVAEKNLADGLAYLELHAKKTGVEKTTAGVYYEILKDGSGSTPTDSDIVTIHYDGTLLSGEKFDSSRDRGTPAVYTVKNLIPGWADALKHMRVGSHWKVTIPSGLAYKQAGAPPNIPANSVLVLDMELLKVEKSPTPSKKK